MRVRQRSKGASLCGSRAQQRRVMSTTSIPSPPVCAAVSATLLKLLVFGCFSTAESTWEAPADYVEPSESESKREDVSTVVKTETESDTKPAVPAPTPVEVCIVISLEFAFHIWASTFVDTTGGTYWCVEGDARDYSRGEGNREGSKGASSQSIFLQS